MIARAAELVHAGLDLEDHIASTVRLDLGSKALRIDDRLRAARLGRRVSMRRLCEAGVTTREALVSAEDRILLPLLGNDNRKLVAVRSAVHQWQMQRSGPPPLALPAYQQ